VDIDPLALAKHFYDISDGELLRRCSNGSLTDVAQSIAYAEIVSRGLALPDTIAAQEETVPYEGDFETVAQLLNPVDASIISGCLEAGRYPDRHRGYQPCAVKLTIGNRSRRSSPACRPHALPRPQISLRRITVANLRFPTMTTHIANNGNPVFRVMHSTIRHCHFVPLKRHGRNHGSSNDYQLSISLPE
jgi:hypothetical protein